MWLVADLETADTLQRLLDELPGRIAQLRTLEERLGRLQDRLGAAERAARSELRRWQALGGIGGVVLIALLGLSLGARSSVVCGVGILAMIPLGAILLRAERARRRLRRLERLRTMAPDLRAMAQAWPMDVERALNAPPALNALWARSGAGLSFGAEGERLLLEKALGMPWPGVAIPNLHLGRRRESDIDLVLIGPRGVLVLESKYIQGLIFLSEYGMVRHRIYFEPGGIPSLEEEEDFEAPWHQVRRHVRRVQEILERLGIRVPVLGFVVFTHPKSTIHGYQELDGVRAIPLADLRGALAPYFEGAPASSPDPWRRWLRIARALLEEERRRHGLLGKGPSPEGDPVGAILDRYEYGNVRRRLEELEAQLAALR
jgi:hypothetical protein